MDQALRLLFLLFAALGLSVKLGPPRMPPASAVRVPWFRSRPAESAGHEQGARSESTAKVGSVQQDTDRRLKALDDQLARARLDRFANENERAELEQQKAAAESRREEIESLLSGETQEYLALDRARESAAREVLGNQAEVDRGTEVRRARLERQIADKQKELGAADWELQTAQDRLRFLEGLNYDSDDLRNARATVEVKTQQKTDLTNEVEQLRIDARLNQQAADESRQWNLEEQRSERFAEIEVQCRNRKQKYDALRAELAQNRAASDDRAQRLEDLSNDLREAGQQITQLEMQRTELSSTRPS